MKGDDHAWVSSTDGLSIGDEIFIASSEMSMNETETFHITGIKENQLRLNREAKFSHFGGKSAYSHSRGSLDMRSVCGVLSRNIVIASKNRIKSDFGGRFLTTFYKYFDVNDKAKTFKWRGVTVLEGVAFEGMGREGANAGFHVKSTLFSLADANKYKYNIDASSIKGTVHRNCRGWCANFEKA